MTQSSYFLTNGSSLEDCHTNFFALADLCGIKWRQYSCEKGYNDLIDDPILSSYTKCINADLLCVWRRVRNNNTPDQSNRAIQDNFYVNHSKELWVFWYGDEPDFSELVSNNLKDREQGSWESGLSYECRTLLFKALHNLIERCLLSKGYTRLGRWFFLIKNEDISDILKDGSQVTFAFNFFLHGDSNVCANVDVRQHSAVRRITNDDIQAAHNIPGGLEVLLSPYGLHGYLTGYVYKDSDQSVQKFNSDWNKIFPLSNLNSKSSKESSNLHMQNPFNHVNDDQNSNDDDFLNKVVEVIIGDFKMKYPVSYIYITEIESKMKNLKMLQNDKLSRKTFNETYNQLIKQDNENLENVKINMVPYYDQIPNDTFCLKNNFSRIANCFDSRYLSKIDCNKEDNASEFEQVSAKHDILKKSCHCQKCQQLSLKKQIKNNNSILTNGLNGSKGKDKCIEREKMKYLKNSIPYHHRSSHNVIQDNSSLFLTISSISQSIVDSSPINTTVSVNANINQSNVTPIIMSYKSPVSTSTSSILNTPGIESSPLSNFNIEAGEHMSPITSKDDLSSINTPNTNQINSSPKEKSTFDLLSPTLTSCDTATNPNVNSTSNSENLQSNNALTVQVPNNQSSTANEAGQTERVSRVLKRSILYKNIYDDTDHDFRNGLLYDYTCELDSWDLPPPKYRRRKSHSGLNDIDIDLGKGFYDSKDPYEFSELDDSEFNVNTKLNADSVFDPTSNLIENVKISESDLNGFNNVNQTKLPKTKQELDSTCMKSILNGKTNSRIDDDINDNDFFNSSGEESNDIQVTKIMNGNINIVHDTDTLLSSINNTNILGPAELSRMFPTPPSLEAMVSSPCNNYHASDNKCDKVEITTVENEKTDNLLTLNSQELDSKDWSFVYKAPIQSSFITSDKYAPLDNVEKHNIPSHCYYKHNVKKVVKNINLSCSILQTNTNQFNSNTNLNKLKSYYNHITPNKINAFPNSMIRNVRPTGQNMPPMNQNFFNRMRPPINVNPMYNFPPDNFNNFRPNMNVENNTISNFISSPVPNFDNRKSPFLFPQQSINSPNSNMISNSLGNYPIHQQKINSPMVGSSLFMNSNLDNSNMMNPLLIEVNTLMLNLLLSDSMFNLFRDHNFESCSICVCNMNIKGNDVGIYLPDSIQPHSQNNYDYYPCTCGFSSLSNRHLSQFSGLFYEDEVDITGKLYDPSEKNENDFETNNIDKELRNALFEVDESIINIIISQSNTMLPSCSSLSRIIYCDYYKSFKSFNVRETSMRLFERDPRKLVYEDCTNVTLMSLNMSKIDSSAPSKIFGPSQNFSMPTSKPLLHEWPFRFANFAINNHDVILMLKSLQPLMQESVQRKGSLNEVTYNTVKGPLTWRQFHRLAGRGTEYQCEPQPIPSLLVGNDKDCAALAPFGLKYWEKFTLEPYAFSQNIYYVVLAPDNELILSSTKNFFKELSTTFEILRLGQHVPLHKLSNDGIFPIGSKSTKKSDSVQLDEWFNNLGESNLASKIQLYAQVFYDLIPKLTGSDRSLFESRTSKSHEYSQSYLNSVSSVNGNMSNSYVSNSSMSSSFNSMFSQRPINNFPHVNNSENQIERLLNEIDSNSQNNDPDIYQVVNALHPPDDDDDDPHKKPSFIIYVVESFSLYDDQQVAKLGCLGLLKSFSILQKSIPDNMKNNIHLQLISIESIMSSYKDFRNIPKLCQLKELAFSVYSQCKQQLFIQSNIKSLTGLGPAASFDKFLKSKDPEGNFTQLFTTPFILAPMKDKQTELGEMFGDRREKSQILFCCYCLTEDQKWLLASCTNDKGDIMRTKVINVHIPNRTRRKNASVRRYGLDKLMKFVQTVMAESVLPWRLVIGRLGRIGHGELKDWTFLLSKKSLLKYSRLLREQCSQCHSLSLHDQPAIFSACLISLEADTTLRVFPNYYTPDERFSSSCNTCSLSTPEDASCTHILVFPTSATTQSSHVNFSIMDLGANLGEEFFTNLDDGDIPVDDGIDLNFENIWNEGLLGSPRRDGPQPDSPGNRQSFSTSNSLKNSSILDVDQDEPAQLLQQPLALAFYVSTARTGPLPRWFWANCPQLQNICPVFLKSALLIHTPFVQQNSDDLLHSNNRDCHSLDSNLTTDVLRCVLEGYNSLSWLALNPETHDRLSCLPLHIQVLMQLYHSVQAFT